MTNRYPLAICLAAIVVVVPLEALLLSTLHADLRTVATKLDTLTDRVDNLRKPQGPPHAVCAKAMSHLDHDVDLGEVKACPNPDDGKCITWRGEALTQSAAEARCATGKLDDGGH
jgi:hypothetical protein